MKVEIDRKMGTNVTRHGFQNILLKHDNSCEIAFFKLR